MRNLRLRYGVILASVIVASLGAGGCGEPQPTVVPKVANPIPTPPPVAGVGPPPTAMAPGGIAPGAMAPGAPAPGR